MAGVEQRRNAGEQLGDFLKKAGLVGAVIGLLTMIVDMKIGGTLFVLGAGTAVVGFAGEKLAGSGKKKAYA